MHLVAITVFVSRVRVGLGRVVVSKVPLVHVRPRCIALELPLPLAVLAGGTVAEQSLEQSPKAAILQDDVLEKRGTERCSEHLREPRLSTARWEALLGPQATPALLSWAAEAPIYLSSTDPRTRCLLSSAQ